MTVLVIDVAIWVEHRWRCKRGDGRGSTRSLCEDHWCQPRLTIHSDGEDSIAALVRQKCDEVQERTHTVPPTASKGSHGRVEQANRAVEGISRTIMQCLETRYVMWKYQRSHPVVQWAIRHAAWLWERLQPGEDGLTGYYRQYQRNYQSAILPFAEIVLWRDPGPHMLKLRSKLRIWSVVGEVCGKRQPRDRDSLWMFSGGKCATNAAKCKTPSSSALEYEMDSIASGAWRTS